MPVIRLIGDTVDETSSGQDYSWALAVDIAAPLAILRLRCRCCGSAGDVAAPLAMRRWSSTIPFNSFGASVVGPAGGQVGEELLPSRQEGPAKSGDTTPPTSTSRSFLRGTRRAVWCDIPRWACGPADDGGRVSAYYLICRSPYGLTCRSVSAR